MFDKVRKSGKFVKENFRPIAVGFTIGAGVVGIYVLTRESRASFWMDQASWLEGRADAFCREYDLLPEWANYIYKG